MIETQFFDGATLYLGSACSFQKLPMEKRQGFVTHIHI